MSSTLTPTQKGKFRDELASFGFKAQTARLRWHYTQQRPGTGYGVPPGERHAADCSIYISLAYKWAVLKTGIYVSDPLHEDYTGWGYTGTLYDFLKPYPVTPGRNLIGDVAIFGTASNTVHTSYCVHPGSDKTAVYSSNGHESFSFGRDAPNPITLHDEAVQLHLLGVFRHPQLR